VQRREFRTVSGGGGRQIGKEKNKAGGAKASWRKSIAKRIIDNMCTSGSKKKKHQREGKEFRGGER